MNGFSGANINCLDHFITPTLVEDGPDIHIVIIHIESNDITHNTVGQIDVKHVVSCIKNRKELFILWHQRSDNIVHIH